jgi:hypothetical protein
VFNKDTKSIVQNLSIANQNIDLENILENYHKKNNNAPQKTKPRDLFKDFYKTEDFQNFLKSKNDPWKYWITKNPDICNEFIEKLTNMIIRIFIKEHGIDEVKLSFLKKKVENEFK